MKDSVSVKLGLIQMKMTKDSTRNITRAAEMVKKAASQGAQIVCLPELFSSIYFPQTKNSDAVAESIPGKTTKMLGRIARENHVVLVGGSIFEKDRKRLYNTSVVFDVDGRFLGKYRKVHIPQDESFYEQEYFSSGNQYKTFKTRFGKISVLICFDQWYPEPARICKLNGADFIFYPTAIGTVRGIEQTEGSWHEAWETVQRGHAISNSVVVAAVNRVGVEGDMTFWGGSFVSDQFGNILRRAGDKEGIVVVDCNQALSRDIESGWGFLRNRRPRTYSKILSDNS